MGTKKNISFNYTLDYYTDETNIPNQDLVNDTIQYFKTGQGARAFKPLTFLNLLQKQFSFIVANLGDENVVITELKGLPLGELEKHILFGFILKWFGGYPIIANSNFDNNGRATEKAIEREFLSYPENTPEKEFCKANQNGRNEMEMRVIAINDYIKYGTPAEKTLENLGYYKLIKKIYRNFDELFMEVYKDGLIEGIVTKEQFYLAQSKHHFEFKLWLENYKNWRDRDEDQFFVFLTKEILIEFLDYQKSISNPNTKLEVEFSKPTLMEGFNDTSISNNNSDSKQVKIEQDKIIVKQYLAPLNGYWNRKKIMRSEDLARLSDYVYFMIEFEKQPDEITIIPTTNISTEFIRQTFYQLHKNLYGRKKRGYWITFLHEVFEQFKSWEIKSTNKNFATYRGNYENDVKNISF